MSEDGSTVSSNGADVLSVAQEAVSGVACNASGSHPGEEGTGRLRSERLRHRREMAGLAQVSGWVPRERRAYAREVLAALTRGANSLPPDPEQTRALAAVQAEAKAARAGEIAACAELAGAEDRARGLAVELEKARVAGDRVWQDAQERAAEAAAAVVRAEAAERGWGEATRELAAVRAEAEATQARERAAQEAADVLRSELADIKGRGGWRGMLLRLLAGISYNRQLLGRLNPK